MLVSLLKDWRERGCILSVRDDGELNAQLKELMCERNDRMIAEGQSERLHACETCEKLVPTENPCSHMGLRAFFVRILDFVLRYCRITSCSCNGWCNFGAPLLQSPQLH